MSKGAPLTAQSSPLAAPAVPAAERWLLALSLLAGLTYPFLDDRFGLVADATLKGLGVAALALAAFINKGKGFRWLAAIMAAGALGDILLEVPGGLFIGGGSFALGHCLSIGFYGGNRRLPMQAWARIAAALLILYGLAMPTLVTPAGTPVGAETLYSVLLCGMAAAMLLSRFAWPLGAAGALLFVLSDTFLIMRLGGRLVGGATVHGLIVWYSYYLGQLLIFLGVARGLRAGA
jgi:uncharacterized membrane protein YhhN